jgi:hypothetical protein
MAFTAQVTNSPKVEGSENRRRNDGKIHLKTGVLNGPKLQKTLVNRGPESNRQKSLAGEILENGDPKTLVYVHLKIQNKATYRGESAMSKVSSETSERNSY